MCSISSMSRSTDRRVVRTIPTVVLPSGQAHAMINVFLPLLVGSILIQGGARFARGSIQINQVIFLCYAIITVPI